MASYWDEWQPGGAPAQEAPQGSFWDSWQPGQQVAPEPEEEPGIWSSVKRDTGGAIQGLGTTLRDLGADTVGGALEDYGSAVVRRNPALVNTPGEAAASPLQTLKEGVGEGISDFGRSLGLAGAGRLIGGALGAPLGPAGVVAGQTIGSFALPAAANFVESYGGIRRAQEAQGIEDRGRAALAAGGVSASETLLGLGGLGRSVAGAGFDVLKRESGKRLLPHIGKQIGIGVATEAPTEAAQSVIERFGGYQPLTGADAVNDYAMSAIKGGIGGGAVRGGLSSVAGVRRANTPESEPLDEPLPEDLEQDQEPAPLLRDQVDERLGIRPPMNEAQRRAFIKEFEAAAAEESGQHIVQNQDNLERALDQGEYFKLRAQQEATQDLHEAKADAAQHFGVTQNPNASLGWDVLGAKVFGEQALDGLLTELAAVKQQQPEHRQQLERALMEHNLVKLGGSGKVPKAGSIARAFENKLKSLQLNEAQSTDEAVAILDAQINDLVAKGKNTADIRLGELSMVYESLTGETPAAVKKLDETVKHTAAGNLATKGAPNVSGPVLPVAQPATSPGSGGANAGPSVGNPGPNPASPAGAGGSRAARVVKQSRPAAAAVPAGDVQRPAAVAAPAQQPVTPFAVTQPTTEGAPAVAPAPMVAPAEPVVHRKRRVVVPAGEPTAFVAPPTVEDQPDNRPSVIRDEAADAMAIARETGAGNLADVVRDEEAGRRQDAQDLPDDAEDRVLAERFKDSPNPQRDRSMAKAYLATMRDAPHGTAGEVVKAIAQDFGVSEATVRATGNTTPMVEAGRRLGFKPAQVRELFQVEDNVKRGRGKVATSEANVATDTAKALARAGIVTGEGATSGFGGLDSDRFWAKETTPAGKDNATLASLGEKIEKLQKLLADLDAMASELPATIERINALLADTQADLAKHFKEAEARARAEAKKRSAKTTKALKRQAKASPKEQLDENDERTYMTERERARRAWDRAAAAIGDEFPRFKELPADYQEEFEEYGDQNWDDADVLQLVRKMEREDVKLRGKDNQDDDDGVEDRRELEFSKGKTRGTGNTVDRLREVLDFVFPNRVRNRAFEAPVVLHQTEADAVAATGIPADKMVGAQGFVDPKDDRKIHLVADNIPPNQELSVLLHEVGVHVGLAKLLGANLRVLARQVQLWQHAGKNSTERKVYNAAVARVAAARLDGSMDESSTDEELVAYAVEEAVRAGVTPTTHAQTRLGTWLRRFMDAVGRALERHFKIDRLPQLNAQDLVDLARGAAEQHMTTPMNERAALESATPAQVLDWYANLKPDEEHHEGAKITGFDEGQPGGEAVDWGPDSSYGPHTHIRTIAETRQVAGRFSDEFATDKEYQAYLDTLPAFNSFVMWVSSADSLALAQRLGDERNAPLQTIALDLDEDDGTWSLAVVGPDPDVPLFRQLRLRGQVSTTATGWTRLEGVPDVDVKEMLTEARRRLTRALGGQVPTITWMRSTGAKVGKEGLMTAEAVKTRFSKAAPDVPAAVQPQVGIITRTLKGAADQALNTVMFTHDLFKRAESMGLTAAAKMRELYERRAARVGALERDVTRVEDLYNRIPEQERGDGVSSANRFVYDSTREAKWGFTPKWMKSKVVVDARMNQRFRRLSPESRAWIEAVFEHGHKMLELKKATAGKAIEDEYGPLIEQAKKADDASTVKRLTDQRGKHRKDFERLFGISAGHPYAPLRRFGNYVVVAKSRQYLAAEQSGDSKKMAELETSADHYSVDFAENRPAAEYLRDQLMASRRFADVQARRKEDSRTNMYGGLMSAFAKLRAEVDSQLHSSMDKDEKASLARAREAVNELYLTSLAETSARKSELRRRGIAGEIDMLRSFATQGRADAHFIAAAENNAQMLETIEAMRRQVRSGDKQLEKSEAFSEIMKRYAASMQYEGENWNNIIGKATRVTSVWMLATSPGYYFQNLTQPVMMSVPYMTGRHGWGESMAQVLRAYTQLAGVFKGSKLTEQARFEKVPADVREAISELVNRGRIDIGMEVELGRVKLEDDGTVGKAVNKADDILRTGAQRMEIINRVSTAMAAYRLELARTHDKRKAIDYADDVILSTHGDYTRFNAPRAFNSAAGRVALQFRKFQLIQLSLLAKLMVNSFGRNASAENRAAARTALAFTLGHVGVMSGLVGLPGFAAVSFILGQLDSFFGDEDEPPLDLEKELRKTLGDGPVAHMLVRGAPTLAGVDLSGKLGMGNALSIVPFTDIEASRAGFYELAASLTLGASGALGAKVWDGIGLIQKGDYYRGLEKLLPRGFSDAAKAYREADEGVTRLNGDVLVRAQDISEWESIIKGMGLPTTADSERRFAQNVTFKTKEHFEARSDAIRQQFMEAKKAGRSTASAVAEWRQLQDARAAAGFTRQPVSSLYKSAQNQKKREKQTVGGVQYTRENRKAVESLAD